MKISDLTKKKIGPFVWTREANEAFEILKKISDHTGQLIERAISYGSTHLKGSQMKMGSTDLELTGVCFAINKLDCWLRGVKLLLITDHKSLTFVNN